MPHKVIELEEFDYTAWRLNDLERKGMHVDRGTRLGSIQFHCL